MTMNNANNNCCSAYPNCNHVLKENQHPWQGCGRCRLMELEVERLNRVINESQTTRKSTCVSESEKNGTKLTCDHIYHPLKLVCIKCGKTRVQIVEEENK